MDQKRFIYTDKDTKQDFCKTLSSNNEILNKPQYELIQPNLKTELNPKKSRPIQSEDFFLYDSINKINQTFYPKINLKNSNILLSFFNKGTKNYLNLITPKTN